MKKVFFFSCLCMVLIMASCERGSLEESQSSSIKSSDVQEWLLTESPACAFVDYIDYSSPNSSEPYVMTRNWEDNTFQFDGVHNQYKVKYNLATRESKQSCDVTVQRDVYGLRDEGETFLSTSLYNIVLENDAHIDLYAPEITDCNPIPFCYYDGMVVRWNGLNNGGKILIELRTTGMSMGGVDGTPVYHYCLADDTGEFVVPTEMFDGMVERALVDFRMTRANVFRVELNGTPIDWEDVDWDEVLSDSQIDELTSQIYVFASAAIARFSMVLVRQLPNN